MKKTKIIIPALGMLLLSTAASVTGTVAWFSMNSFVNATNMNILAKAEEGIVISNEAKSLWSDSAIATKSSAVAVYPTSTATGATWCHSASNNADSATSNNKYSMLTLVNQDTTNATGAGYIDKDASGTFNEGDEAYYVKNAFFIKSSSEAITKPLYVTSITTTLTTSYSTNLNKALRVLVVQGSNSKVFAPFEGATTSYTVVTAVGDNDATANVEETDYPTTTASVSAVAYNAVDTQLGNANIEIPGRNETPLRIDIYLYFEGEDANCKSTNLAANLDNIEVSVKFGTKTSA